MYKIMFSVGEASGDLHGASLAVELRRLDPDVRLFGMGGQAMRSVGVDICHDIADVGVMGLVEVLWKLPQLFRLRDSLAALMAREQPDVLVLIDYPDFNMRLLNIARQQGVRVVYYIGPSVWVWRRGRAGAIARLVSKVAAVFPFEAEIYRQAGANVEMVGHPLVDIVRPTMTKEQACSHFAVDSTRPVVLLLPGSRRQEITALLPAMLVAAERIAEAMPQCQFYLPTASTISQEMLQNILNQYSLPVTVTEGHLYDLMQIADAAIAASGTVVLEAALMDLPAVVIYKLSPLTWCAARMLIKIPHVSLPNMIVGREILPELLQQAVQPSRIAAEILAMLTDSKRHARICQGLAEVRAKLGDAGAVRRVAKLVLAEAAENDGGTR